MGNRFFLISRTLLLSMLNFLVAFNSKRIARSVEEGGVLATDLVWLMKKQDEIAWEILSRPQGFRTATLLDAMSTLSMSDKVINDIEFFLEFASANPVALESLYMLAGDKSELVHERAAEIFWDYLQDPAVDWDSYEFLVAGIVASYGKQAKVSFERLRAARALQTKCTVGSRETERFLDLLEADLSESMYDFYHQ